MAGRMTAAEIWANLDRFHTMSPRELYENEELENLKDECVARANRMASSERRLSLSVHVRDHMLSDTELATGRGWEEVLSFLDWVDGGMD